MEDTEKEIHARMRVIFGGVLDQNEGYIKAYMHNAIRSEPEFLTVGYSVDDLLNPRHALEKEVEDPAEMINTFAILRHQLSIRIGHREVFEKTIPFQRAKGAALRPQC